MEEMIYSLIIEIETSYDEVSRIRHYCESNGIKIAQIDYLEKILFKIIIDAKYYEDFEKNITNILSRKVDISIKQEKYVKK